MKYRGVAYYPEYWPEERWDEDIRLMRDAHINLVRVGEFAWTAMEPEEGQFKLEWLDRLVAKMAAAEIDVLLCTPTATPPAWLTAEYPEAMLVYPNGMRAQHGHRRHYCPTHPVYRMHVRRIVDALSRQFSQYPNVIAWQIDNELGPECSFCYCDYCQAQFRAWLQRRYGTLDELNRRWATRFWSMEFTAWEQVRLAHGDKYSAILLDTRRFHSDSFVDFAAEQARVIRANHPHALVTTNGMGAIYDPINYYDLFGILDVAADDLYYDLTTMAGSALAMDVYRNYKPGKAFWITETGSGALTADKAPAAGQLRAWAWSALARGCEAYCFFRWRTCLSGQEQELQGVLEYSGKPRRRYAAVQALYAELETYWPHFAELPLPHAEVAILNDYNVNWGYKSSRINAQVQYDRVLCAIHKTLYDRNVAVDVIPPERDLRDYRLVVLPSSMMVNAELAAQLRAFIAGGGHVLALPQLACRDENDNYLPDCPPVHLRDLFGLRVEGGMYLRNHTGPDQGLYMAQTPYTDETPAVRIELATGMTTGSVRAWMEDIELEGGTALGVFTDNDFAGSPFLVEHHPGEGRTLYCGAYPTPALLQTIVENALACADIATGPETPEWVEIIHRGSYTFLINHRDETVTVPCVGTPVIGRHCDGVVHLAPYDVCVLAATADQT